VQKVRGYRSRPSVWSGCGPSFSTPSRPFRLPLLFQLLLFLPGALRVFRHALPLVRISAVMVGEGGGPLLLHTAAVGIASLPLFAPVEGMVNIVSVIKTGADGFHAGYRSRHGGNNLSLKAAKPFEHGSQWPIQVPMLAKLLFHGLQPLVHQGNHAPDFFSVFALVGQLVNNTRNQGISFS